jgi:hypothetical protein
MKYRNNIQKSKITSMNFQIFTSYVIETQVLSK